MLNFVQHGVNAAARSQIYFTVPLLVNARALLFYFFFREHKLNYESAIIEFFCAVAVDDDAHYIIAVNVDA